MKIERDVIERAKVLVVGAGGVGSEVLKGLALSGFQSVEIVDLDVIELTNLNRQLLYRRWDIGRSKAEVAQEAIRRIGHGKIKIVSHCADIRSAQFDTKWFRSFDCIIGTLDNLGSRQRLNLMSMASGVPLIESGTEGYKGQVTVHLKGVTRCYDCDPKPAFRQSYAVCTIRNRPTETVHCVVWAREYLFEALFGEENFEDDSGLRVACTTSDGKEFTERVFTKVFKDDVERGARLGNVAVTPLRWGQVTGRQPIDIYNPNEAWTLEESIFVFEKSILELKMRHAKTGGKALSFDKDDDEMLDFVASASNIRAQIFRIKSVSRFMVKQMAARVVPAVSTTNAIVSGLIILQLISLIKATDLTPRNAWVSPMCVVPETPSAPLPSCVVCSIPYFSLKANLSLINLQTVIGVSLGILARSSVIQREEITVLQDSRLLYDAEFTENLTAPLAVLNVAHADRLHVIIDPDIALVLEMLNTPKYPSGSCLKIFPSDTGKSLPARSVPSGSG